MVSCDISIHLFFFSSLNIQSHFLCKSASKKSETDASSYDIESDSSKIIVMTTQVQFHI